MTALDLNTQNKLFNTILSPILTEKTSRMMEKNNQYGFRVRKDASKQDIKRAIEEIFKVTVTKVQTLNTKPKQKVFKGNVGYRKAFKKAYVSLTEGQTIKLFSNE